MNIFLTIKRKKNKTEEEKKKRQSGSLFLALPSGVKSAAAIFNSQKKKNSADNLWITHWTILLQHSKVLLIKPLPYLFSCSF